MATVPALDLRHRAEALQAKYTAFRQDPWNSLMIRLRHWRAAQLRTLLSDPDTIDIETFNREVWRLQSAVTIEGRDISKLMPATNPVDPELIEQVEHALDAGTLEIHGNFIWGSGTKVYGASVKSSANLLENLRWAILVLNDQQMEPLKKFRTMLEIPGFGPNSASGLVMVFHPKEFGMFNKPSESAVHSVGYIGKPVENFEQSLKEIANIVQTDDFLELDWFLYLVNEGRISVGNGLGADSMDGQSGTGKTHSSPSLQAVLAHVLDLQERWTSSNTPDMQERGRLVRSVGPAAIRSYLSAIQPPSTTDLATDGSDGTGLKTRVPWIRVFSKRHSPRATKGWYAVYLFAFDGETVYLSLNQGTTEFSGGDFKPRPPNEIAERTTWARELLESRTRADTRLLTAIQLHDRVGLGAGYERGNVVAYRYQRHEIPGDQHLREDLSRILQLLSVLYQDEAGPSPDEPTFSCELIQEQIERQHLQLDKDVLPAIFAALESGKHIILTGPPGTAKTTLAQALAIAAMRAGRCRGHVLTTATSDWTTFETVGGLRPDQHGALMFAPGQFVTAVRENRWLVIDELNRANFDRAFGQLFTVLSGQAVELPYVDPDTGLPIVLVPEEADSATEAKHCVIVPTTWRVIGTMNVFDKSLLFEMSFALMRRFAFIEVPSPEDAVFRVLIQAQASGDGDLAERLEEVVAPLLALRKVKELGPAIFIDMAKYARVRLQLGNVDAAQLTFELFYSYLLPQFEGISDRDGQRLYTILRPLVDGGTATRLRRTLRDVLGVEIRETVPATDSVMADAEALEIDDVDESPEV
jgi:MoxR-like ATPase